MANNIQVTTSELRNKADELRGSNRELNKQIGNLQTEEASLNSMWDGEANDAFHNAFTSDIEQMSNFYNAVESYCAALERIAQQYDVTEQANQGIASTRSYS